MIQPLIDRVIWPPRIIAYSTVLVSYMSLSHYIDIYISTRDNTPSTSSEFYQCRFEGSHDKRWTSYECGVMQPYWWSEQVNESNMVIWGDNFGRYESLVYLLWLTYGEKLADVVVFISTYTCFGLAYIVSNLYTLENAWHYSFCILDLIIIGVEPWFGKPGALTDLSVRSST